MSVILYSHGCQKCHVLETKLKQAGIDFDIVFGEESLLEIVKLSGIDSAPILKVDAEFMDFGKAIKWIKEQN